MNVIALKEEGLVALGKFYVVSLALPRANKYA